MALRLISFSLRSGRSWRGGEKKVRRCQVLNPGLVEYGKAWEMQRDLFRARSQNEIIDTFLILQHPPTYTFGRRTFNPPESPFIKGGLRGIAEPDPAVYRVDRGGGATYH